MKSDFSKHKLRYRIGYKLFEKFGFIEDIYSGFGNNAEYTIMGIIIPFSAILIALAVCFVVLLLK